MQLASSHDEMPTASVGLDRQIMSHGVWVAGLKITDRLIKSLALEYSTKPAKLCTLTLTSEEFCLHMPPGDTDNGLDSSNTGKIQQIPFFALREVAISPHNQHLLMVIYVDASDNFSILVCSCDHPRAIRDVTHVFKKIKQKKLFMQTPSSPKSPVTKFIQNGNWTLRAPASPEVSVGKHPPRSLSPRINGSTPSSDIEHTPLVPMTPREDFYKPHLNETLFRDADNSSEVFLTNGYDGADEVKRYPAGANRCHVTVQVQLIEAGSDNDSIASTPGRVESETQLHRDNSITYFDQKDDISAEEYHNRKNRESTSNGQDNIVQKTAMTAVTVNGMDTSKASNGESSELAEEMVKMELGGPKPRTAALRSVSQQTVSLKTRYTKKPLRVSLSNRNKEKMAAIRKRGGSGSDSVISSGSTQSSSSVYSNGGGSDVLGPSTISRQAPRSVPSMPRISTSSSTVSKPIERVYSSKKRVKMHNLEQDIPNQNNISPQMQVSQADPNHQLYRSRSANPQQVWIRNSRKAFSRHSISERELKSAINEGRVRRISSSSTDSYNSAVSRGSSRSNSLIIHSPETSPNHLGRVMSLPVKKRVQMANLS